MKLAIEAHNPRLAAVITLTVAMLTAPFTQAVGPSSSNQVSEQRAKTHTYSALKTSTKLNVIVPIFDPNIPTNPDDYAKLGIWPEVRNTEAKLFSVRLRDSLQATGAFGAVRTAPTDEAIAELYVKGKIIESNSEDIELEITLTDISNTSWYRPSKSFKYRVNEYSLTSARSQGNDPYAPIYKAITEDIVAQLSRKRERTLVRLQQTSGMVLARSYSDETFGKYIRETRSGKVRVRDLPADNDPKFERVQQLRAREEIFIDELQNHYQVFASDVGESYLSWQQDSFPEAKEYREARRQVRRERGLGIASAVAAVVLATQGGNNDAVRAGAIAGGIAAGGLIYKSFRTRADSKIHFEQLKESGQTLDLELGPKNIAFEDKTAELTGTAAEQFQQHRDYLQEWYADEATPEVQL